MTLLTPGEWNTQVKGKKITAIKVSHDTVEIQLESDDVLRVFADTDHGEFNYLDLVLDNATEEWTFS